MQIIGIYLDSADVRVRKKLQEKTWYPFGKFSNCHEIFKNDNDYNKVLEEVKNNQLFVNELYELGKTNRVPNINLNCIVGKNGAGKSSLITLEYRIINNLSCKIKFCLQHFNQDYHPTWAYGFNAELFYELNNELFCIKVDNNFLNDESGIFNEKNEYEYNRVNLIFKNNSKLNATFNYLENERIEKKYDNNKKNEIYEK